MQAADAVLRLVRERARTINVPVAISVGGATDCAFYWLLKTYWSNDSKLEELADLIAKYVISRGLDGVDLDMECFWPVPEVHKHSDQGGRIRGSKWGDPDQGPSPGGIGLRKLV